MQQVQRSMASLLIVALLLLASSEASRKKKETEEPTDLDVHIQVFSPKGILVWYPHRPEIVSVAVQIYLNQDGGSEEDFCDICLNATTVTKGKFMMRDEDVVIFAGDHLSYIASAQDASGQISVFKTGEFYVADSRIIYLQKGCPADSATAALAEKQRDFNNMMAHLETLQAVINDVFRHCNNISGASRNLYIDTSTPVEGAEVLDDGELYDIAHDILMKMNPTYDWKRIVVKAFYCEHGIAFEVTTLLNKLIVLQLAKHFTTYTINDLDDVDAQPEAANDLYARVTVL